MNIKHKLHSFIGYLMLSLLALVVGALVGELKTIVSWVNYPFHLFAVEWLPSEKSPDFVKALYAGVCLLLYLYLLQGCIQLFFWGVQIWKGSEELGEYQSLQEDLLVTSYSEEIASTIELIDHPGVSDDQVQIALDDLMKEIGRSISKSFPNMDYRDIRHCFLTQDENGVVVMIRLGRQMILKPEDAEIVDWVLTGFSETHVLEPIPADKARGTDMKAVGLVRNQGDFFRLGFVILLPQSDQLTEETRRRFYNSSLNLPLIAHMDKLMKHMVKYTMKMKGGAAS